MPLTALLSHIDRDERRQDRVRAGLRSALPYRADISYVGASSATHKAWIKPKGTTIPDGAIVLAVRRDAHGQCHPVMLVAFEGDAATFASFPRLALMLGATELHLCGLYGTMLDRVRIARDLEGQARFDRAALLSRPLAVAGRFDRSAIMATACAAAKARQSVTGETWGACLSAALKGVWTLAKTARLATAH